MDLVKRSRFASKQIKAGPAPLASFEDLPSDELESPEDFSQDRTYNLDDESGSRDLQFTTPDSLTVSSQSTPRIESDFDSQFTLTPGDSYQGQSTSELRTASLSSLSKEDSTLNIKQKKGSAVSLGTLETTEIEYTHRKSSWTDIFRSHNQSSAKTSSISYLGSNEKSPKKKSRTAYSKKDTEVKAKDKGKFLSIFKKKSNKQINSPVSPDTYIMPNENLSTTECLADLPTDVTTKVGNGIVSKGKENEFILDKEISKPVSKGKENESPTDKESVKVMSKGKENELPVDKKQENTPCEIQNDLGKVNSDRCDKIPDERRLSRKVINIPEKTVEKEYNILSRQVEEKKVDKVSKTDNIQAIVDVKDDLESSESELTFEVKDLPDDKKEDDFEAETLLPPDLSEIEDDPIIDLQPVTFEVSKQIIIPSRQQRLEITTKPIERPRSTTPINVAPLEAFIQSVSPTFDSKVDKIKLSLPGEQFVGRVKSPKKSSMKSWTDFCERGLHSPRMHKKIDKDSPKNSFECSDGASSTSNVQFSSPQNWAAFESDFTSVETNMFSDNFKAYFDSDDTSSRQLSKDFSEPYQYFESNFSFNSSSSEMHAFGCTACLKAVTSELSDAQTTGQPASSAPCEGCTCQCHSKQKSIIKSPEMCSNIGAFGDSSIFNLVSDEQF